MTEFTRISVLGSVRRAELVVPDDEPFGALLPRVLELLEEPSGPASRPLTLVRTTGEQISSGLSADQQQIRDGESLRLVRADEAPPPPEVADVTDVVGDSFDDRSGRWSTPVARILAAVGVGVLTFLATWIGSPSVAIAAMIILGSLGVAVAGGGLRRPWLAVAGTAAALGAGAASVQALAPAIVQLGPGPLGRLGTTAITLVVCWVVLAVGFGFGLGKRAAAPAGLLGAVLAALPLMLVLSGMRAPLAVLVGAALAQLVCGFLPWFALATSGLTGLDDEVVAGKPSGRPRTLQTVNGAYASLGWAVFAVAPSLIGGVAVLITTTETWLVWAAVSLTVLSTLRARAFPLVIQRIPLLAVALVAVVCAAITYLPTLGPLPVVGALTFLVVVLVLGAGVGLTLAKHQQARLRRWGNVVEAIMMVALPTLVLGAFGVFADLLEMF
ncbi:MAG: EsaB/YukD family protein [Propionibacteriales bacterium]|nr:EsaB/YukD family protein [Propionibacteriales bacterium]